MNIIPDTKEKKRFSFIVANCFEIELLLLLPDEISLFKVETQS
jgi:hypothetical protein